MPGKIGGNQKDFTRPKNMGHKWSGIHDDSKEGRDKGYQGYSGYVKDPIKAAGSKAKKGGAVRGSGASKPKSGPLQKPKGKVVVRGGS